MRRYLFYLLLIIILYFPALKLGFSQDDFFFLKMSAANSLKDVLNFFNPLAQGTFPFYRPLGTQLYFFLFQNPFAMHLFMLLVHALSVTQVFKLFTNLGFNKRKSNLVSLIYLFSSVHFLSLVYISATQHLLATTFSLLSLNAFFAASPLSTLYFLLALLSKESSIILPIITGLLYLYRESKLPSIKLIFSKFSPYVLLASCYVMLRLLSGITIQSEYHYTLDGRVFSTLRFYLMFVFGFMESVQDYPFTAIFTQYLFDTKPWGYLTLIGSFSTLMFLAVTFFAKQLNLKNLLFGTTIIVFGLTLYLGLPAHLYPHYLDYSLLGFLLILGGIEHKTKLKLITLSLIIASIGGIYSSFRLHWSPTRSRLNALYIPYLKSQGICQSSPVVLSGDPTTIRNLSYSLGVNGVSVICRKDIDVYFLSSVALPAGQAGLAKEGKEHTIPPGSNIIEVKPL